MYLGYNCKIIQFLVLINVQPRHVILSQIETQTALSSSLFNQKPTVYINVALLDKNTLNFSILINQPVNNN